MWFFVEFFAFGFVLVIAAVSLLLALKQWRLSKHLFGRVVSLERTSRAAERNMTSLSYAVSKLAVLLLKERDVELPLTASQHGEELYLWQLLGFRKEGVFIEVGAYNGVSLSNSLFFESIGWRTLLVEAHPDLAQQCREHRPGAHVVHAAAGERNEGTVTFSMVRGMPGMDTLSFVTSDEGHRARIENRGGRIEQVDVPQRSLQSMLAEFNLTEVDCLSIDVEGAELGVLRGLHLEQNRPRLIMVEDNSNGQNTEVTQLLKPHGYEVVANVGCNVVYQLGG